MAQFACLRTLHSQADSKTNFVPNRVLGASPPDISPLESLQPRSVHHTYPVAFWSLPDFEQLQGPHHQRHIRCLSGVWSGTALRRASVQLSKPSDATHRLWDNPAAVVDFLNLDNCWAITTTTTMKMLFKHVRSVWPSLTDYLPMFSF